MRQLYLFCTLLFFPALAVGQEYASVQPVPPVAAGITYVLAAGLCVLTVSACLFLLAQFTRYINSFWPGVIMTTAFVVVITCDLGFGVPRERKIEAEIERVKSVLQQEIEKGNTPVAVIDGKEFVVKGVTFQSEMSGKSTTTVKYVSLQPKGKESFFSMHLSDFIRRAKFSVSP